MQFGTVEWGWGVVLPLGLYASWIVFFALEKIISPNTIEKSEKLTWVDNCSQHPNLSLLACEMRMVFHMQLKAYNSWWQFVFFLRIFLHLGRPGLAAQRF